MNRYPPRQFLHIDTIGEGRIMIKCWFITNHVRGTCKERSSCWRRATFQIKNVEKREKRSIIKTRLLIKSVVVPYLWGSETFQSIFFLCDFRSRNFCCTVPIRNWNITARAAQRIFFIILSTAVPYLQGIESTVSNLQYWSSAFFVEFIGKINCKLSKIDVNFWNLCYNE